MRKKKNLRTFQMLSEQETYDLYAQWMEWDESKGAFCRKHKITTSALNIIIHKFST